MEGGFSFPGRKLIGRFNVSEIRNSKEEYEGDLYFQWSDSETFHTIFKVSESGKFSGYKFSSVTKMKNKSPIEVTGSLKLEANRNSSFFDLTFHGIEENFTHEGRLFFSSNKSEKLLTLNIKAKQSIYLKIHIQEDLEHLIIDFMWDRDQNPLRRVFVQLETRDTILLELIIMNFNIKIEVYPSQSSSKLFVGFGTKTIELDLKCQLGLDNLEILFAFESSFLSTKELRAHIKFIQNEHSSKSKLNKNLTLLVSVR